MTGLSLSKITNLSSALMTVLLALNLHSVAAQMSGDAAVQPAKGTPEDAKRGGSAAGAQSLPKEDSSSSHPTAQQQKAMINKLQGWSPVEGLMGVEGADKDEGGASSVAGSSLAGEGKKKGEPVEINERVTQAEQALTDAIAARNEQQKLHDSLLAAQQEALEKEQKALNEQLKELGQNSSKFSTQQEQRRQDAEKEIERLAHVYEQMPPRDAATMFNVLDMRVMVPVAQHMTPRKISDVMGNMEPDRANILSQYLAGLRKLSADALSRLQAPKDYGVK